MFKRFHISLTKAHDNGSEGSSKIHANELIFVRISLTLNITRTHAELWHGVIIQIAISSI